jgi:hypothetical protein
MGMAFVSDDTILVAERGGAIKAVRNGVVDPTPVPGAPWPSGRGCPARTQHCTRTSHATASSISATKPLDPPPAPRNQPPRGGTRWSWRCAADHAGRRAGDVGRQRVHRDEDIFVGEARQRRPDRVRRDGMLCVAHGGGDTQNRVLGGKILRLTDEARCRPTIRSSAVPTGRSVHDGPQDIPADGEAPAHRRDLAGRERASGGDEVNILAPGANYGWPLISLGRTYGGPWRDRHEGRVPRPDHLLDARDCRVGISFYTGDRLPKWKGDVFVTGMRYGEIPGTGQLHRILINKNLEELRREPLLVDLRRRIRDVKQGRDGLLYLLTDEADAVMLRIEPAE